MQRRASTHRRRLSYAQPGLDRVAPRCPRVEQLEDRCLLSIQAVTPPALGNGDSDSGESSSLHRMISADGRYVAFHSYASNLAPNDTNGQGDVFVRDLQTGAIALVSTGSGGQGDSDSNEPTISADGRYVAFTSWSSTLVAGGAPPQSQVFLRDLQMGTTSLVSVSTTGGYGNHVSAIASMSADGRYIAFASVASNLVAGDTNDRFDIFVRDMQTGVTTLVSGAGGTPANGDSYGPSMSDDGRFVAFSSTATNLAAADVNANSDIYVRNLTTGVTSLVSVGLNGPTTKDSSAPNISADGRFVVFQSLATNLVASDTTAVSDIFLRDLTAGVTNLISVTDQGQINIASVNPAISGDGRYV